LRRHGDCEKDRGERDSKTGEDGMAVRGTGTKQKMQNDSSIGFVDPRR
jgi:hypothetical protein